MLLLLFIRKMELHEIDNKVKYFCVHNNKLCTIKNRDIFLNNKVIFQSDYDFQEVYSNGKALYSNFVNGGGIIVSLNDAVQEISDCVIKLIDHDCIILGTSSETLIYKNDSLEAKVDRRIFKFSFDRNGNKLVYLIKKEQEIISFSIGNNMTISTFPLSTLGTWLDGEIEKPYELSEFCGIWKNTLVCTLNNGDVLLVDIEKGEVIRRFEETNLLRNLHQKSNGSPIFWGLNFMSFVEINVSNGELLRKLKLEDYLRDYFERSSLVAFNTAISLKDLFYFQASTNIVGIFNPVTAQIMDYHEFDFDKSKGQQLKGGKENLQVKDGKIYCLDTLGNLYELESKANP